MMDEERGCRECCAERNISRIDGERLNLLPKLVLFEIVGQKLCRVVRCTDDDACGRGKRELESRIPDDAWLWQNDEKQRDSQTVERVCGFPE